MRGGTMQSSRARSRLRTATPVVLRPPSSPLSGPRRRRVDSPGPPRTRRRPRAGGRGAQGYVGTVTEAAKRDRTTLSCRLPSRARGSLLRPGSLGPPAPLGPLVRAPSYVPPPRRVGGRSLQHPVPPGRRGVEIPFTRGARPPPPKTVVGKFSSTSSTTDKTPSLFVHSEPSLPSTGLKVQTPGLTRKPTPNS